MAVTFTIINIGTLSMNRFWNEKARVRSPSSACTLLQSGDLRILVDPSPDPEQLKTKLFATTGLTPDDVDIVFLTHFHGDHRFGLELFTEKRLLMAEPALAEWRASSPSDTVLIDSFEPCGSSVADGIAALGTPGHTLGHHSLSVTTDWGNLIVAGDAAMTRDFLREEEGFHNSVDFGRATQTVRELKGESLRKSGKVRFIGFTVEEPWTGRELVKSGTVLRYEESSPTYRRHL